MDKERYASLFYLQKGNKMKRIRKKISTVMLSMLAILCMAGGNLTLLQIPVNAEASSGTVTSAFKSYGDTPKTFGNTQFKILGNDGNTYDALCAKTLSNPPKPGKSVSFRRLDRSNELTKIAYWCYLHPGDTYSGHHAASYVHCGKTTNMKARVSVSSVRSEAAGLDIPSNFEAYIGIVGGSYQDLLVWRNNPIGRVKILKSVADSKSVTDECKKMYSLKGAEYTIYDSSNKALGKLTTDEDGSTNEIELNAGRYTVKETDVPDGYSVDQNTYTVDIKPDETTTVESKDSPIFSKISIALEKLAEGKSYLNKDGDMSGAEFEISYYDEILEEFPDKKPIRKWIISTSKDESSGKYYAFMKDSSKVSGDDFFKNDQGEIVVPRGTIFIEEIKAPRGYKLDTKRHVFNLDQSDGSKNVEYNFGAIPQKTNKPYIPCIGTKAISEKTEDNVGEYGKKIKIIDKVSYKELSEGEEYTVKGTLMDKKTGKPIRDKDGKEIKASKTFTVTKENSILSIDGASGSVDLEYELDSTVLKGKTTVVFERLYYENDEIASHADINDEGQSIYFPEIKTTAKSNESGTNIGNPSKEEIITDLVKYDNLVPFKEYTVKGVLMDKDTGKPIKDKDGKEIRTEKTFTPKKSKGSIELTFKYDSSLREEKQTVVFESLEHNGKKVASHEDINDENQTIKYPKIRTTFTGKGGEKTVLPSEKTDLIDVIKYENLIPGKEYTLKGELMIKETKETLRINNEVVQAEAKFVPDNESGMMNVMFTVDTTNLEDKELVAYEALFNMKNDEVAKHKDINDKGQTLKIVRPPKTGDISSANKVLFLIFILGSLELLIIIKIRTNVRFLR